MKQMNIDAEKFIESFQRNLIMREYGIHLDNKMDAGFEDRAMKAYRNDFRCRLEIDSAVGHTLSLLEQSQIEDK